MNKSPKFKDSFLNFSQNVKKTIKHSSNFRFMTKTKDQSSFRSKAFITNIFYLLRDFLYNLHPPLFLSISGNNFSRYLLQFQSTLSPISVDILHNFSRYLPQFQSKSSPVSVDTLSSFSRYSPQFQPISSPISVDTLPDFSRYTPRFQSISSPVSVDTLPTLQKKSLVFTIKPGSKS